MITAALYLIGAILTLRHLWAQDDGTDDEPLYCLLSSLLWPLFWGLVLGLRAFYAWQDREFWRKH